jgi:hypothetical protein
MALTSTGFLSYVPSVDDQKVVVVVIVTVVHSRISETEAEYVANVETYAETDECHVKTTV